MSTDLEKRKKRRIAGKYPVVFFVRATAEEADRIHANAAKANRPRTRFLAETGALEPERLLVPRPSAEELRAIEGLLYELHKIGVNLNQLAYRENSAALAETPDPSTDAEIAQAARAVTGLIEQLRSRLR
jgi:hypothetical protein